jgi:hypothetical protein
MKKKLTAPNLSHTRQLSKRRINESRDLWLGLFTDALNALLSSDDDRVKSLTRMEADELAQSALNVADAALAVVEERFPNV